MPNYCGVRVEKNTLRATFIQFGMGTHFGKRREGRCENFSSFCLFDY